MIDKTTKAFGLSLSIVIILNTIIVILKESFHPFHKILTQLTGNHWASHGIIDIVLFVTIGVFLSKKEINFDINKTIIISTLISIFGIIIYFILKVI